MLGCAFACAALELGAIAPIDLGSAHALGGIAQAAGHLPHFIFGMAAASVGSAVGSVGRLLPEGVLSRRCPAAGGMAGAGSAPGRMIKEAPSGGRGGR